ncbi:MAG: hypothetical protein ACO1SX_27120 [Actinomycetota bacterium]
MAAEPPAPVAEIGEHVDQGDSTPPHGDPLTRELAPSSPPVGEESDAPEPLDDGTSTPPHGEVLPVAPVESRSEATLAVSSSPSPTLTDPAESLVGKFVPADGTPASEPAPLPDEPLTAVAAAVPIEPVAAAPAVAEEEPIPELELASAAPSAAAAGEEAPPVMFASPAVPPAEAPGEGPDPRIGRAFAAADATDAFEVPRVERVAMDAPATDDEASPTAYAEAVGSAQAPGSESLSFREVEASRPVDDLEAAALHHPAGATLDAPTAGAPVAPEERHEGSPNWMLAFICAWSGATSLYEAWLLNQVGGLRAETLGLLGYLLLGIGLVAFAIEALGWGRPRRSIAPVLLPTLLTLVGVVCLVLWDGPARPL